MKLDLNVSSIKAIYAANSRRWKRKEWALLRYLASLYSNSLFFDIGTRNGGSAVSLASNPSNIVYTFDIQTNTKHIPELDSDNIKFFLRSGMTIEPNEFERVEIIYLDISHNGTDEELIINKLDKFKGILLLDDIDCPERWKKLHELWNDIKLPKIQIPKSIGANRGTGLVIYGDHEVSIK